MLKKIPFDFDLFDAYSETDYNILWKWKVTEENSHLNNSTHHKIPVQI